MNLRYSGARVRRKVREARMIASAMKSTKHPVLVHLVPVRRCNLSCTYCNEFDDFSTPVPTAEVIKRIDILASLGALCVHLSGGEPMLHPDVERIVEQIRSRDMLAGILTNGYLLTPQRIQNFNRVGLDHMQISIDNVNPDDVSKKSLKVLDQKLKWLAEYAEFEVNINSVLGCGIRQPQDALTVARRAVGLGLTSTIGVIHDGEGQVTEIGEDQRAVYNEIKKMKKSSFWITGYNKFQDNIVRGLPNEWHCRAGSRYLYVCEDGLVHYCSQQRGYPAIPLENYGQDLLEREYHTVKSCASFCTISCVHRVSMLDELRARPIDTLQAWIGAEQPNGQLPLPVRFLTWMFVTGRYNRFFRKAAARLLAFTTGELRSKRRSVAQ